MVNVNVKWLQPGSYKSQRPATNSQVDRQKLGTCDISKCIAHETEYMASSLYFADPPDYQGALDLVLLKFDPSPKAKSLGGLSRELLDIGMKSAVKCGDKISAKNLADSSKSIVCWQVPVAMFKHADSSAVERAVCWHRR